MVPTYSLESYKALILSLLSDSGITGTKTRVPQFLALPAH